MITKYLLKKNKKAKTLGKKLSILDNKFRDGIIELFMMKRLYEYHIKLCNIRPSDSINVNLDELKERYS